MGWMISESARSYSADVSVSDCRSCLTCPWSHTGGDGGCPELMLAYYYYSITTPSEHHENTFREVFNFIFYGQ